MGKKSGKKSRRSRAPKAANNSTKEDMSTKDVHNANADADVDADATTRNVESAVIPESSSSINNTEEAAPAENEPDVLDMVQTGEKKLDSNVDFDTNEHEHVTVASGDISEIDTDAEMTMDDEAEEDADASLTAIEEITEEPTTADTVGIAPGDEDNEDLSEAMTEHVNNVGETSDEAGNKSIEIEIPVENSNEYPDDELLMEVETVTPIQTSAESVEVEEEAVEEPEPEVEAAHVEEVIVEDTPPSTALVMEDTEKTPPPQDNLTVEEKPSSKEPVVTTKEPAPEPNDDGNGAKAFYTVEELKTPIDGVDWSCRENYLTDDDIQKYFAVSRSELKALSNWKKQAAKKKIGIF